MGNRKAYKSQRNSELFNEYSSGSISLEKLAKKYNLTRQRVHFLIHDFEKRGFALTITAESSEKDKNLLKEKAIKIREMGKYDVALNMFKAIEKWEEAHNNSRSLIDVYGHIFITYNKLAKNSKEEYKKIKNYQLARVYIDKSLKVGSGKKELKDKMQITKVHLTNCYFNLAALEKNQKEFFLNKALKSVNSALKDFPGSKAHMSWPLVVKSKILLEIGKAEDSLKALKQAEGFYNLGIKEEENFKLTVWLNMIHLGFAKTYFALGNIIQSKFHANAVINYPDKEGILFDLKNDTKEFLEKITNS